MVRDAFLTPRLDQKMPPKRNFGVKWLRVLKQLQFIILLRAPLIVGVGAPCCGYILPQTQVI